MLGDTERVFRAHLSEAVRGHPVMFTAVTTLDVFLCVDIFLCVVWAPPRRELWVTVGFPPSLQPCQPSIILGQPFVERTITEGT